MHTVGDIKGQVELPSSFGFFQTPLILLLCADFPLLSSSSFQLCLQLGFLLLIRLLLCSSGFLCLLLLLVYDQLHKIRPCGRYLVQVLPDRAAKILSSLTATIVVVHEYRRHSELICMDHKSKKRAYRPTMIACTNCLLKVTPQ